VVKRRDKPVLGFIVEGGTEKLILEETDFFRFLNAHKILCIKNVIDATGNDHLLPVQRKEYVDKLKRQGANRIIILTDQEDEPCVSAVKTRILGDYTEQTCVVVAKKEIESWFLSDTGAIRSYIEDPEYLCNDPEAEVEPYELIKKLRVEKAGIGTSTKKTLAKQIISNHGFSIEGAASHDKCTSARYFLDKVLEYGKEEETTTP